MNRSDRSSAAYLDRVGDLLADIEEEERLSLLADLADQLAELSEPEFTERLGTPEEFATEYRRSAGLEPASDQDGHQSTAATAISVLALPLGVVVLFSFGGQRIFGPFVLAIEWILARISPAPLRVAWSSLPRLLQVKWPTWR